MKTRLGRNVLALAAVSLLTDVATEMTYPLLPLFLSTVLGASAMAVGAIEGAAESTAALLRLGSGWLSDRVPRRKPLVLAGYGIASLIRPLIGLAQSAAQVLAIRVTDRVGKGIRGAPRDALIADSVDPAIRGRAFGFHRAADHAGAVIGPLLAFAFLRWGGLSLRTLFLLTAIPGLLAVAALIFGVREVPRTVPDAAKKLDLRQPLGKRFWAFLAVLFVFTLGNSTDAFLLLRAADLGVPAALVPILWAVLHVIKSASSTPGGALSDRLGRNVLALGAVSFLTDVATEMTYPLIPVFLATVLGASATYVGTIEGAAETTAALLKWASGWWSDRVARRKPLVLAGYLLASAVRPLTGLAQSAAQVLGIRVADRVGKGIRTSPRDALIADSVDPAIRGRAFGFHNAADNLGAVLGPLIAFAILRWEGLPLRTVFLLTAIPGALAVLTLLVGVREVPRTAPPKRDGEVDLKVPLGRRFWAYLGVLLLFTLGNSTDAFLLLRAGQLGVATSLIPILWALLNLVKAVSNTPGGILSDRLGRKPLIAAGWLVYAAVYFLFGRASQTWHAWALFAVYGVYFGLTEGVEKALVADLVPKNRRGSAFGWYNLAIGIGALPASLLFGALWDRWGSATAFNFGALLALAASLGVILVVPRRTAA